MCDQLSGLDLSAWKTDLADYVEEKPQTKEQQDEIDEISPEILNAAVERAKEELNNRKKFEYEAWLERKFIKFHLYEQ